MQDAQDAFFSAPAAQSQVITRETEYVYVANVCVCMCVCIYIPSM